MIKRIILTPFQKFVKTGSTAGTLLFVATIFALFWANSSYQHVYENILQFKLGFSFHNFELKKPLILWINDGLMAIFFFLIGLELKRELLVGEINTLKKATFPIIAALGGVIVPIVFYLLLNQNADTINGWGITMATDIAFALAILSLLGDRIPISLKVFLTAFAIIDDIAAVVVIAIFYSSNINIFLLIAGVFLIIVLALLYYYKKYSLEIGLILAIIVWFLFLKSGIHPTIAGVLLAFTIPIKRKLNTKQFATDLTNLSTKLQKESKIDKEHLLSKEEMEYLENLDDLTLEVISPLQHLEHVLHKWIAYFILPVFAFANAGVVISTDYNYDYRLVINIVLSLFLGKFIGVTLFSYLGIKLKLATLPLGLKFNQIVGIAAIAGVGFTMAIFIDHLAFAGNEKNIISAKIGIIIASLISGVLGYLILRFNHKN